MIERSLNGSKYWVNKRELICWIFCVKFDFKKFFDFVIIVILDYDVFKIIFINKKKLVK